MYTTCLFCNGNLERNEIIEAFPVGRRLAFDTAKGRLWVVCRRCARWNLTPLEERWEAIEQCERAFESTRLRTSTDNIGFAKLREGLELVRIGAPLRPEFAAWRYGDQFGRRRKRAIILGGAAGVAGAAVVGGAAIAGASLGGFFYGWQAFVDAYQKSRTVTRVRIESGERLHIKGKHAERTRLVPTDDGGWALHLTHSKGQLPLTGPEAIRVAGNVMAGLNRWGGTKKAIARAVDRIELSGHPERYLIRATTESEELRNKVLKKKKKAKPEKIIEGSFAKLPLEARLALEVATNEENERRAMEEDLAFLEAAWRNAEELANISDSLLIPDETEQRLRELKEPQSDT